jgi:hypothetical protein
MHDDDSIPVDLTWLLVFRLFHFDLCCKNLLYQAKVLGTVHSMHQHQLRSLSFAGRYLLIIVMNKLMIFVIHQK